MKLILPIEINKLIYNYSHNIYFLCLFNNIKKDIVNDSINYFIINDLKLKERSFFELKKYLINNVKLFCENIIRNLVYFNKINLYENVNVEFINFNIYKKRNSEVYSVSEFLILNEKYGISTYIYEIINSYIFYYSVLYNRKIRKPLLVDKSVLELYYNKYHNLPKFVYCIPCNYHIIENLQYDCVLHSKFTYTYYNRILNISDFDIPYEKEIKLISNKEIIQHTYNLINIEKIIKNNDSILYFRNNNKYLRNILYEKYIADIFIYISFIFDEVLLNNDIINYYNDNKYISIIIKK